MNFFVLLGTIGNLDIACRVLMASILSCGTETPHLWMEYEMLRRQLKAKPVSWS